MGRIDGEEFVTVFLHADAIGVMALAESFCAPRLKAGPWRPPCAGSDSGGKIFDIIAAALYLKV